MALKVLFLVQFGVGIFFSLSFILMPVRSMKMYGVKDQSKQFELLTRLYGTVIIMYCLVALFASGMEDSSVRRGLVIAYAVSMGTGFIVFFFYMIRKTLNAMGWIPTALQGMFLVAYTYFAIAMKV